MKNIIFIILLHSITWGMSGAPVFTPDEEATQYAKTAQEPMQIPAESELEIDQANKLNSRVKTGDQSDIDKFNASTSESMSNSAFTPRPFDNRTNSYWLDPNYQFGPGSVNDFGGDPNAEEMLQPFVY
ncbi:MAG: hypothetical protein ACRCTQ_02695 [Brevinemataceae bacterium]